MGYTYSRQRQTAEQTAADSGLAAELAGYRVVDPRGLDSSRMRDGGRPIAAGVRG